VWLMTGNVLKSLRNEFLRTGISVAVALVVLILYANQQVSEAAKGRIYASSENLDDFEFAVVLGTSTENFIGGPNPYFYSRIDTAASAFKAGKVDTLILSGGGQEPDQMSVALHERGVPLEAMLQDHQGVNTRASVEEASKKVGDGPLLVISQGFHVERAIYLGDQLGVTMYGLAAEDPENPIVMAREFLSRLKAVVGNAIH